MLSIMQMLAQSVYAAAEAGAPSAGPALLPLILVVVVCANLAITIYVGFRVFRALGRVREESRQADELARTVQAEWELFNRNQTEKIHLKLTEVEQRAGTLEERIQSRINEVERQARDTRIEVERVERYIREVFEVELKNMFDSFDTTVNGVLDEMKRELLRGVDRIEEIQAIIEGRDVVEGRLTEGRAMIQGLTDVDQPPRVIDQNGARPKENDADDPYQQQAG